METQLKIAVEFGYPPLQVKRVLHHHQFSSAGDLMAFLFDTSLSDVEEEEEMEEEEKSVSSTNLDDKTPIPNSIEGETSHEEKNSFLENESEQSRAALQAETLALLYSKKCDHCYKRDKSVVALPCSHLTLCIGCAPLVKLCPQCRQFIEMTILTYIA